MNDPFPALDHFFPLNVIAVGAVIIAAIFVVPSLYWVWSEHRDNRRLR